jgi:hypothetical protein
MEFNGRGDASRSISGNSSGSFITEGQGFISHMPIGPAVSAPLINADPDQGHIAVRRDFSDSAFWNAAVRTDKDGKASVDFKVPDSLTNWQVVVTAVSRRCTSARPRPIPHLQADHGVADAAARSLRAIASKSSQRPQPHRQGAERQVRLKVENGEIFRPKRLVWVDAKSSVNVCWDFRQAQRLHQL